MKRLRQLKLAVVAGVIVLAGSSVANADISGTVRNTAGVSLDGVSLELVPAGAPSGVAFSTSNADGTFTLIQGGTGTFTVRATEQDGCRAFGDPARSQAAEVAGVNNNATGVVVTIDVRDFCNGSRPFSLSSTLPDPTGLVDGARRRILVAPGGIVYVRVHVPFGVTNPRITLQDGTQVSAPPASAFDDLQLTAPAGGYSGLLKFSFDTGSGTVVRDMGTLTAAAFTLKPPSPGVPYDVEAIVDISGSMAGSDPKFLRKDALNLLGDLSGTADGLGAVGFDNEYQPIFDLTKTTSQAVVNQLKARVKTQVINRGGTDYNVGMDKAWDALNAPGVDPNKPKLIIFLTDGGHNAGDYNNGHLRFAAPGLFNGVTQRSWPVCAVQLGRKASFLAGDVVRLKRIASDTGGKYFATQSSTSLNDIYFKCRGQSTGQQAILSRSVVFTKGGQQRQFSRRLAKRLRQATFFVNSGGTFRFQMTLIDPKGHRITRSTRRLGLVFRAGKTFQFFRITRPPAGSWRIIVKAIKITDVTGRGQVTISVPTK